MKKSFAAFVVLLPGLTTTLLAGTHMWSGAGADKYWNNAANWSAGGPPAAGEAAPVRLIFPALAAVNSTNNIANLALDDVTIYGSNYTFSGISPGGSVLLRGGTNITCAGSNNVIASTLDLVISNATTIAAGPSTNAFLSIRCEISGPGHLIFQGAGTLDMASLFANTFMGGAEVRGPGTLQLHNGFVFNGFNPRTAIPGPLEVVFGTVKLLADEQIAGNASVKIDGDALLDLNDHDQTIGPLTMNSGNVDTGAGTLTLNANVLANGSDTAIIKGRLSLGGTNRVFNVTSNIFPSVLFVNANVSDGGTMAGLTKQGAGFMSLSGTNTFTGPVVVNGGQLAAWSSAAFGATNSGTIVNGGGSLNLAFNVHIAGESLSLSGTGSDKTNGAMASTAGTNSWSGPITLASNATFYTRTTNDHTSLNAVLSGAGGLTKIGPGTLVFGGTANNTFAGTLMANEGTLLLSKTNGVAVPGALIVGDNLGGAYADVVRLLRTNQIADTSAVTVNSSGLWDLNQFTETIGSLSGSGNVFMTFGGLVVGGDNSSSTFDGALQGVFGQFTKLGSGTMIFTGTNTHTGVTTVNGGTLLVNGVNSGSDITLSAPSAVLGGTGRVANVTVNQGTLSPGSSPGKLTTGSLNLSPQAMLEIEINGAVAGAGYDQLNILGTASLGGSQLRVKMGFAGSIGNQYLIGFNDGADAVSGTFASLPDGTMFTTNGVQFRVTYQGGTGNDIVLTQLSANQPITLGPVARLANGNFQISAMGGPSATFTVQANTDLGNTNGWSVIGTTTANNLGAAVFTDTNALLFSQRSYRFLLP